MSLAHLVPVHDAQRIGARLAVDDDAEDRLPGLKPGRVLRRDRDGPVERRDAVHAHPAPDDLLDADRRGVLVPQEFLEPLVDVCEQRALPAHVAGRWNQVRRAVPVEPAVVVEADHLAGELVESVCILEAIGPHGGRAREEHLHQHGDEALVPGGQNAPERLAGGPLHGRSAQGVHQVQRLAIGDRPGVHHGGRRGRRRGGGRRTLSGGRCSRRVRGGRRRRSRCCRRARRRSGRGLLPALPATGGEAKSREQGERGERSPAAQQHRMHLGHAGRVSNQRSPTRGPGPRVTG